MSLRIFAFWALIVFVFPAFAINPLQPPIQKSPYDDREYASTILDNGLSVVVVSDKKAPTAGAALIVKAGLYQDPKAFSGIAHFLEHMLFLGTKKFPTPDEFQNFVQAYGGDRNAMTQGDKTSYYFSIQADAFEPALERFADFFISPAFYPEYVDRELNAVEQEFQLYFHQDSWAAFEVSKETSNPHHPYHSYFGGNLKTLGYDKKNLVLALHDFFKQHYHAKNMTLTLVGPQSTATLLAYAKKHFSSIARTSAQYQHQTYPALYTSKELGTDVFMKAKGQLQEFAILFPLSHENDLTKRKSKQLVASILGHEGKGSLIQALKKSKWITGMTASYDELSDEQDSLVLSFSLTDEGRKHVDDVTRHVFQMIRLLQKQGIPQAYFEETKAIHSASFLYAEKTDPSTLALAFANSMHKLPIESILTAGYILEEDKFSQAAVTELLSNITPNNMRRVIIGPDESGTVKSKWYQAEYRVEKISESTIKKLTKPYRFLKLSLPKKNEFIPTDLKIAHHTSADSEPQKIREGKFTHWHYQDHQFQKPKGSVYINFQNPRIATSAENALLSKIYTRMVIEYLTEEFYPAAIAGSQISFHEHPRGLTLSLSGYSDKQRELLTAILHSMKRFKLKNADFEAVKGSLVRRLQDFDQHTLLEKAQVELNSLILSPAWHPTELLGVLKSLNVSQLKKFKQDFWDEFQIEMFTYGNLTQQQAERIANCVQNIVPIGVKELQKDQGVRIAELPVNKKRFRQIAPSQGNHVVLWYIQNPVQDDLTVAKTLMLSSMLEVPFYQTLRVDKQLAYTLGTQPYTFKKVSGLMFAIQSTQADPKKLVYEIKDFLGKFNQSLSSFNKKEYVIMRDALIQKLTQEPQTLHEQCSHWWSLIENGENDFHQDEKIAKILSTVELNDIAKFAHQVLDPNAKQGELFVLSAPLSTPAQDSEIASTKAFKRDLSFVG